MSKRFAIEAIGVAFVIVAVAFASIYFMRNKPAVFVRNATTGVRVMTFPNRLTLELDDEGQGVVRRNGEMVLPMRDETPIIRYQYDHRAVAIVYGLVDNRVNYTTSTGYAIIDVTNGTITRYYNDRKTAASQWKSMTGVDLAIPAYR